MLPKDLSMKDRFLLAKETGFEEIEGPQTDDDRVAEEIARAASDTKVRVHSVMNGDHWRFPLSSGEPDVVAKSMRAHWEDALPEYLETRASLAGVMLLMDIRHPFKPQDQALIAWCLAAGVPLHVLLSKADKLGRGQASATLHSVNTELKRAGATGHAQLFSALKGDGTQEAWRVIADWLELE